MNKAELVAALEGRLGSKKVAAEALEAIVETITRTVARGEKVAITGFGSFEKVARGPRVGRNPRTGETVKIKKTSVARFRPGTAFKGYVADPRTLPKAARTTARTASKVVAAPKPVGAPAKATATKATATKATATKATATKAAPAKVMAKKVTAKKATTKAAPAKATATKATATKAATPRKAATSKTAVPAPTPARRIIASRAAAKTSAKRATKKG